MVPVVPAQETLDWLKINSSRPNSNSPLPATRVEGPCECDLCLRRSKFFTASEYAPRLRACLEVEQQLIKDVVEGGWPREVERHSAISGRICGLLAELGEPVRSNRPES